LAFALNLSPEPAQHDSGFQALPHIPSEPERQDRGWKDNEYSYHVFGSSALEGNHLRPAKLSTLSDRSGRFQIHIAKLFPLGRKPR
jgi:hypothetical protein